MSRPDDPREGFLSRWARRKQELGKQELGKQELGKQELGKQDVDSGLPAVDAAQSAPLSNAADPTPTVPDSTEPATQQAELPLPSLDDMLPGGDVSVFLQKHVPDALRNAALRKAWATDPEISGFIEMADYQWDFANPDSIPGWSSKLEGVDVTAMVERIFAAPAPRAPEADLADAAMDARRTTEAVLPDDTAGIVDNTDTAENSDTSSSMQPSDEEALIQNGAVQNNTKESSIYDVGRKRHGGALPS